jgi:hypothetical protein
MMTLNLKIPNFKTTKPKRPQSFQTTNKNIQTSPPPTSPATTFNIHHAACIFLTHSQLGARSSSSAAASSLSCITKLVIITVIFAF